MFLNILETILKNYFKVRDTFKSLLFVETSIIPIRQNKIGFVYYYYLLNYYTNCYIEYVLNNYFNYFTYYNIKNYYEFSYRRNGMDCSSILNGTILDIFNYTRKNTESEKLITLLKCNLIVNNQKNNIRQILRKYDTRTKLYDIIYYNFPNDVENDNNNIDVEIGKNTYNLKNMDKLMYLCDA